jgi:hypothetical protein
MTVALAHAHADQEERDQAARGVALLGFAGATIG